MTDRIKINRVDAWGILKMKLGLDETSAARPSSAPQADNSRRASLLTSFGDGQRTEHLARLAGWYLARGFDLQETIEHCVIWNDRNNPPLDREKVISTCESIAASDARNHPRRQRADPTVPLFDIADARVSRFLTTPPAVRRWVLEDFLQLGIVGAVVAPGGSSKSQFLMQLAYSVAAGLPVADYWAVGEPGAVLMLCAEDAQEEIHRRVYRMHQQIGLALTDSQLQTLNERLLIRSMVGLDVLLTETGTGNEVRRTPVLEQLLLTAKQAAELKLIIIDPASRFRGGDENSNADATRFVQALEYLAQESGATVLIAHHTNKGAMSSPEANQNASRGASALTDGIRWQLALSPLSKSGREHANVHGQERLHHVEASLVKTNYTARHPAVLLRREDGGYLTMVKALDSIAARHLELTKLLVLIEQHDGELCARNVEDRYGGRDHHLGMSQRRVRELVDQAILSGHIRRKVGRGELSLTPTGLEWIRQHSDLLQNGTAAARAGKTTRRRKSL